MESPQSAMSSPPSVFSLDRLQSPRSDWSQSTLMSPISFPDTPYNSPIEKLQRTQSIPLFRPTFTLTTTTDLHFIAFPPHDLKHPTSSVLGGQSATHVLTDHYTSAIFQHLIGSPCTLQRIPRLPASSIQSYIFNCEKAGKDEWEYYALSTTSTSLPLPLRTFTPSWTWHLAVRQRPNSQEKLFFGPLGMMIRSICEVHERPVEAAESENAARQLLYLAETTDVKCPTGLRWWVEKKVGEDVPEMHKGFRAKWDESVVSTWEQMRPRREVEESLLD